MTDAERKLLLVLAEEQLTMATAFGWKDKAAAIEIAREAVLAERRAVPAAQRGIHESSSDLGHG